MAQERKAALSADAPLNSPPPDWFGWAAVLAVFLLPFAKFNPPVVPFLSVGEAVLLPLAVLAVATGFLQPLRAVSAALPALLWLAACAVALFNGFDGFDSDLFLGWTVRLVLPSFALLPLLGIPAWRDRILWALAGGVGMSAVVVFWQARLSGLVPPDRALLDCGGLLTGQAEYGVLAALALPLVASWRGGENLGKHKALATLFCTFLLPVVALSACFDAAGLFASAIGLAVAWAAWRRHAWILGVFLLLLVFGHGAADKAEQERAARQLIVQSAMPDRAVYADALRAFEAAPFLGSGTVFTASPLTAPWYAFLLGGTGLIGLGMWLALLGDAAARSGTLLLGSVLALAVVGIWTSVPAEGAGTLVGLILALSAATKRS